MAKAYIHRYTVKGTPGITIPADMLRYDTSYPADGVIISNDSGEVRLQAIAPKEFAPSAGRWASFGWKVTSHTKNTAAWA